MARGWRKCPKKLVELFDMLVAADAAGDPCPSNPAIAARLDIAAASASRWFEALERIGAILVIRRGNVRLVSLRMRREDVLERVLQPIPARPPADATRSMPLVVVGKKAAWCEQCQQKVGPHKMAECGSRFCSFLQEAA